MADLSDEALSRIHAARLVQRDIDQLLGICEFALLDGMIDQGEAEAILQWLEAHPGCLSTWPASVLYSRLRRMLSDGILDDQEQGELLGIVLQIAQPRQADGAVPTTLPLDNPPPAVVIPNRCFCFTGAFDFGTRAECHAAIESRGGTALKGITKKLHYLVIGSIGSDFWRHTSFGAKIAKAVEYRDAGSPVAIVSEAHWISFLP